MATKNHAMGSSAKAAANITKPTIGIVIEFPAILAIDLLDFTESSTSGGAPHNFDWYLVVGITCVDSSSVAEANRWNSFFFSVQDIKWTVAQAPSLSLSQATHWFGSPVLRKDRVTIGCESHHGTIAQLSPGSPILCVLAKVRE